MILQGSVKALLQLYKTAIDELIETIKDLNEEQLTKIVDTNTKDPDCKSVQAILGHVVCSGFGYIIYMENHIGLNKARLEKISLNDVNAYTIQLLAMHEYSEQFFLQHPTLLIEEIDNTKKINVSWGQQYDVEQLMEHAVMHVMRHRLQIIRLLAVN